MTATKTIEISKQRLSEKISATKRYLEKESYYVNEPITLRKHLEKKKVQLEKNSAEYKSTPKIDIEKIAV